MDKQQAQQIIKDTFGNSFDKNRFARFIKDFLNGIDDAPFTYQGNYIPDAYKQYIKTLERIGKFSNGENSFDILVITLQKETSLERARTMQRNFIAWYLNGSRGGEMKDAALAAFVSPGEEDWRFSLVKMDYKFEKTKTGRMKVKEEFTPARRWSFLVGANEKSHTAQSRLVNILANDEQAPTLDEIEKSFDIETVTKEFFFKYRELFLRTKEELDRVVENDPKIKADFEKNGVDTVNFAKKLLGQIVFLYFLQKKGWFGVGRNNDWGTGSKHFLQELFKKKHSDYNNFYNDILEPLFYEALRIDRSHDDGYYSRFDCKIPFLNGGLFDPIGNYDWVRTDIIIPDKLFSNTRKTKEGDTGDGILDIFDLFNFTVKEDEPLEKEVAIDPELLGKAYEKFNAIRPDNYDEFRKALKSGKTGEENKFNKKFGVYYTPREIVHYMCRQSLINYLATSVTQASSLNDHRQDACDTITKEDIETLIHTGEQVSENEIAALIKEQNIKEGKQKTSGYKLQLSESIRSNAALIDEKLADITVCDPAVGSGAFPVGMMSEIVRARNVLSVFLNDNSRTAYEFKRRCIEHSLYGVDIDPGAVEIAKLRLWLSLVVDEDDIKNIKPLPNLDYKIVRGNSLLGVEKDLFNLNLFNELEKLKPLFFKETNPTKKQEYKKQIDILIRQITNGHTEFDFEIYFSEVFHNKGGFDVVIGNPPYVVSKDKVLKRIYEESVYGRPNLYGFFIHKSLHLLSKQGVLTFINPRTLLTDAYFSALRRYILKHGTVLLVLNIVDRRNVFESVLQSAIVNIISRNKTLDTVRVKSVRTKEEIALQNEIEIKKEDFVFGNKSTTVFIVAESEITYSIFRKLAKLPLFFHAGLIFTTGKVQWDLYKKTLSSNPGKLATRLVWAENIQRFYFAEARLRRDKLFINEKIKTGSPIQHKTIIIQRTTAVEQPFRIIATIVDPVDFGFPIQSENNTSYLESNIKNLNLNFVIAILNSRFLDFVFRHINSNTHVSAGELNGLPFPNSPSINDSDTLVNLVGKIISAKKNNSGTDTCALEAEIDQLVYKLYDLTPEEIKIVEDENENAD